MNLRTLTVLLVLLLASAGAFFFLSGSKPAGPPAPGQVPAGVTAADIETHNRGVGLMGAYDFLGAVDVFEGLVKKFPGWHAAEIDYGIALLNRSRPDTHDLDHSLELMLGVLKQDSGNLRARHCVGLLLLYRGHIERALPYFKYVAEADPTDAYAAYFLGDCHYQLDHLEEAILWFNQARERDPSLRSAYHGGFRALRMADREEQAKEMFRLFEKLEDNPQARIAEIKYTRMGPHAAVRAIDLPEEEAPKAAAGPLFLAPEPLGPMDGPVRTWRSEEGMALASVSACDIDSDGHTDLFLANVYAEGPPSVLVRGLQSPRGGYQWVVDDHPLTAVTEVRAALWGDYDNDGLVDVYLCRQGPNQLWQQVKKGQWVDVTEQAQAAGTPGETTSGAFVDADHDGDLDLLLVHAEAPFEVLINRLDGTFMPLPTDAGIPRAGRPATGLVLADLDHDRDLDILLLHAEPPHSLFVNDRLWRWHAGQGYDALLNAEHDAALAVDADADGQVEVYAVSAGQLWRWQPGAEGVWVGEALATVLKSNAEVTLGVMDANGDGDLELLISDSDGWRLVSAQSGAPLTQSEGSGRHSQALYWNAEGGDAVIALVPGAGPRLWKPGPGRHAFAALSLSGKHNKSDQMRSNADAIGVRVAARVGSKWTVRQTYRRHSGPGQSLQPLSLGLGTHKRIDFVDLLFSDGLLQTERDLEAGQLHRIEETQRQTSSCPVLFAWDGERFAFVTDLLGVGGIGFWVAPDTYAPPAPNETILLPAGLLKPRAGKLVLKLGEPMEEACYLDGARLTAIDLPPGWKVSVDERMAVLGPAPSGEVVFFQREARPIKAVDQGGRDVLAALSLADHKAVPVAAIDPRFIGHTKEQVLTLEFQRPLEEGDGEAVLIGEGWIEYPYAQTLFAGWQAEARYEAPTIEARAADGSWSVLLEQFGYPAGMPRAWSVPLKGLPKGCLALRIRTTQEIYWDRLAVAWRLPCPEAKQHEARLVNASLAAVGFAKRTTGPQRLPHYDYDIRTPLWDARFQRGHYTRFGPVLELLAESDDAVTIFGPGEEIEMRFEAIKAPPPKGWTRRYFLRTSGWCKDMDLFTLDGETVGPLPTRDVGGKAHAARAELHRRYQTRYESGH